MNPASAYEVKAVSSIPQNNNRKFRDEIATKIPTTDNNIKVINSNFNSSATRIE
ncbi:hypothetical protein RAS_09140 [Rickettsia asiatica]|uniref:Uncharacterized protein n=1 Tax=Rickettsia asiatica TaxID=238800 RepID=A0A510GAG6_9RICK|nr:hypothetical protein RAS_09140 [Rickettsia asiatica]